jgi:hypothetical protein
VLDPTLAEREPHRSRLAMYTELLRIRRAHPVLTDPSARQEVTVVDDTLRVVRSTPAVTASLVLNFSPQPVERTDTTDSILFDADDARWGGPGLDPGTVGPWSARLLSITP